MSEPAPSAPDQPAGSGGAADVRPPVSIASKLARVHPGAWPVVVVVGVAGLSAWNLLATAVALAALAGILTAVLAQIGLEDVRHGARLAGAAAVVVALVTLVALLDQIGRPVLG